MTRIEEEFVMESPLEINTDTNRLMQGEGDP